MAKLITGGTAGKGEKVHVRKRKDEVWRVRDILTVPNWAMLKLLSDGQVHSQSAIYASLGKQFTRKTLILSINKLATELGLLEPQHAQGKVGFQISYALGPETREMLTQLAKYDKYIASRKARTKAPHA